MERSAGILMPVSSLPSRYGFGCFSQEAYEFVDWLVRAGQSYWQILPLGPTGFGDSPYQSFSTFAGSPYYIDLEALIRRGLLTRRECDMAGLEDNDTQVDYLRQYHRRFALLRLAFGRSGWQEDASFAAYVKKNAAWLADYAHFMAIKAQYGGAAWFDWEEKLRFREPSVLSHSREELRGEIAFYQYLQYLFFEQWEALHSYALARGVKIIGDLPIYVSLDSADAWAHPELFQLDEHLRPTAVAGCPPDGFSAKGQLWGNPLYRWETHKATEYAWWIERLRHCLTLYDVLRIDHFRGFDSYYSIPYGAKDATGGHWETGPGVALFEKAISELGAQPIIAEDLGYMTDSVKQLLSECGFPGMRVLQFAFDSRDESCHNGGKNDHLPHLYPENCVTYTGTHDNQTLRGWLCGISEQERELVRTYLCDFNTPTAQLCTPMIGLVLRSAAALCIIPLQDYLGYDDTARVNTPATLGGNWQWRLRRDALSDAFAEKIRRMTDYFGRGRAKK